jgi:uncharacterized repeat protein (TIGR01451 family)
VANGLKTNLLGIAATLDGSGNSYVLSAFIDSIDIDPSAGVHNLTGHSYNDLFFAKYDPSGNLLWGKSVGGPGEEYAVAITVDVAGNILIAGTFTDTADFDPGVPVYDLISAGGADCFFAKYDAAGNLLWAKAVGNVSEDEMRSVGVDASQNVIVTGTYTGTVDFDPNTGVTNVTSAGDRDIFFLKLSPTGNLVWSKSIGGTASEYSMNAYVDGNDNLFIIGQTDYIGDLDPGPSTFALGINIYNFFAKYDVNGDFVFAKGLDSYGVSIGGYIYGITVDAPGNIYISGSLVDSMDFDTGPGVANLSSASPTQDAFFAKYDMNGNYIWAKDIGGMDDEISGSIQVDVSGNVYIAGRFTGTVDFDPGIGVFNLVGSPLNSQTFFAKYNVSGNLVWAKNLANGFSGAGVDAGYVFLDALNNVYVAGIYTSPTDFDPGPGTQILTPESFDTYFAKYSQDPCSSLALNFDSQLDITCTTAGTAKVSASGGTAPYTFLWDDSPATAGDSITTNLHGVYTVTVNDGAGCSNQRSVIINGPSIGGADLDANLITDFFRPTLSTVISLDGYNVGCVPATGSLTLIIDTLLVFDYAIPAPTAINGDTLTWSFTGLAYDSLHLTPEVYVHTPVYANIGDTVSLDIEITPIAGDLDSSNNHKLYKYAVVNSYDPNIKQVYPQGEGVAGNIANNQTMTYTVQFQNTGNAEAINIHVDDTLDNDLDIQTLRIIASSDSMVTEILPGNVLRFKFDNIHLPDSTSNEPASHGYLVYEIEQVANLSIGTEIMNTAYIYFDFNPPVITNTTLNTISALVTSVKPVKETENAISIYPNPAREQVTIAFAKESTGTISLTDVRGRTIMVQKMIGQRSVVLNTEGLISGFYLINVLDKNGDVSILKMIKE